MNEPIDAGLDLLACPVCRSALARTDRTLHCAAGHGFDLARQGYVNLLRSAPPANADTAPMLAARERFLASGAYQPIRAAVVAASAGVQTVAEVGAGTGHYLAGVLAAGAAASHLALDVSAAAARRSSRLGLASAVADTWAGLPLRSASLDGLLCVFAPRNPAEFARVLRPGGRVVIVTPTADHLAELRSRYGLLSVPPDKTARLDANLAAVNLCLADRVEVGYQLDLDHRSVADLIEMGPNAFHHRSPGLVAEPILAQVAVTVSTFRAS